MHIDAQLRANLYNHGKVKHDPYHAQGVAAAELVSTFAICERPQMSLAGFASRVALQVVLREARSGSLLQQGRPPRGDDPQTGEVACRPEGEADDRLKPVCYGARLELHSTHFVPVLAQKSADSKIAEPHLVPGI